MSTQQFHLNVAEADFDEAVLKSEKPVLVDFWAPWCRPCLVMGPAIEQLAEAFDGRATVAKVNVDENPALSERFKVTSIPTLILFRDGQVVDRLTGIAPQAVLAEKLAALTGESVAKAS